MNDGVFVGIDTSNYTTSLALCDCDGRVLANIKRLLPVASGERGLRQSDAVFSHVKNLPELMDELDEALDGLGRPRVLALGVSATPRDCKGSYMPCFVTGISAAASFATAAGCPLYRFSHQSGHIMAALYSSERTDELIGSRFGAFHISGGTTDLLLVSPRECDFDIERVGGSRDINAGQAIDRTGVLMGLGFPCGREMEKSLDGRYIPRKKTRVSVRGTECNLSGLENLAAELYKKSGDVAEVSAYVFDFIAESLYRMTEAFREEYGRLPVLYAGGVMSNRRIRERLSEFEGAYFSEPEFSSDNAAGVALLARRRYFYEKNQLR